MFPRLMLAFSLLLTGSASAAPPPAELAALLPAGGTLLEHARADLNGDGRDDYVYIVEAGGEDGQRVLHIAIREVGGKLHRVKSNAKLVRCARCGGVMGDPFNELSAQKNGFSVSHYGGSGWRWATTVDFRYSSRDKSWQLVRAEKSSFHVAQPDDVQSDVHRPPKDFGKIDIADFDPDHYLGVGPR